MFKDAFLDDRADSRRPWTVAVSFLAQCLAICIAILIPLLTSSDLPARQWMAHLLAPPPLPPAAPPAAPAAAAPAPAKRFDESAMVTPAAIPERVAAIVDAPAQSPLGGPGISGVVGVPGTVPGAVPNGLLSRLIAIEEPPPPAKPKAQVQQAQKPVRIGGSVQAARILHRVEPAYPPLARQARVSGLVRLEAIIGEDGLIRELRVISGHPLLVRSALEAVRQWRYRPTLLNEKAVAVITQIDVNFRLGG